MMQLTTGSSRNPGLELAHVLEFFGEPLIPNTVCAKDIFRCDVDSLNKLAAMRGVTQRPLGFRLRIFHSDP